MGDDFRVKLLQVHSDSYLNFDIDTSCKLQVDIDNKVSVILTLVTKMILKLVTRSLMGKQKQLPGGALQKRCSWKFRKIHRKYEIFFSKFLRTSFL